MIGKKIIQLESVDSTNNYVANLILKNEIEPGTVILADEQTNGRGQRGNTWNSKSGENIITSIYLKPAKLSVTNQFYLTVITSLSVVSFLKKNGVKAKIKWPNDIVVENKKIAGILIENQINGNEIAHVTIGIGLNLNQKDFNQSNITSVINETSNFNPVLQSLLTLINELNSNHLILEQNCLEVLKTEYLKNLWLKDELSSFSDKTGEFKGIIKGVSENGLLEIEKNGELIFYSLKEIQFNARNVL